MLNERRDRIVETVNRQGVISFGDLAVMFPDVSDMTLRKDLRSLDEDGRIVRIHGGARSLNNVLSQDVPLTQRLTQNIGLKREIAKKAAAYVREGSSVFLDSGSTMTELADIFPDIPCTVFCGGLSCVDRLSRLKEPGVYLLGGMLNKSSLSVRDPRVAREVESFHFDISFISVNGFTPESGFCCRSPERQLMEQAVLRRSGLRVVLMDSTKVGQSCPFQICRTEEADVLISDTQLSQSVRRAVTEKGVTVL